MDFDDLREKAPGVRMLILSNPHNPVGRAWERRELEQLSEICIQNDIMIVSDEIHSDIIFPGYRHTPLLSLDKEIGMRSASCFAPSKTFNIAGLSTSAILIPDPQKRKIYNDTLERFHLQMGNLLGNIAFEAAYNQGEDWLEEAIKTRPWGRLLSPRDIAMAALYFASDESELVTGSVLDVEQYPVGAPPNW